MLWLKAIGSELLEWLLIAVVALVMILLFSYAKWSFPIIAAAVFAYGVYRKAKRKT